MTHASHPRDHTDPQLSAVTADPAVTAAAERATSLSEMVMAYLDGYAARPALARPDRGGAVTYAELAADVRAVAAEWHHHDGAPLRTGDVVALLGFTSPDYATLDLATTQVGAVSVPLQSSASQGQLTPILDETAAHTLCTGVEYLETALAVALDTGSLRRVIVFDHDADAHDDQVTAARTALAEAGSSIVVDTLDDVRARGRALPAAPAPEEPDDEDPLALLLYTSGSTGTPKGAMYPRSLVRRLWSRLWPAPDDLPVIGFNYMPMSHLAGRVSLIGTLARGGTAWFTTNSDLSTLFADLARARPTDIMLVPRVCDMLHQRHQAELDRHGDEQRARAAVRDDVLGGRVLHATCGTAPLSTEMHAFVEACLGVPLHIGYGSTEDGVVLHDEWVQRPPVIDYKLVDVPELGYRSTDRPHPRGELLVRAETLIPGYYRRPEATAEVFDDEGYYRTGDVVAEIEPDRLRYVDRRKNVIKLAQGEFVAVSRLEATYVESPIVRQIFVYGSGERAHLLAVVVPVDEALARVAEPSQLRGEILAELARIARDDGLNSYEVPRDVLVETTPFTNANGLLSDARKLLRPRLAERYGERLEALYAEQEGARDDELRALRRDGRDRPVAETVTRAAAAVLGVSPDDLTPDTHFTELGGDSLSALSLASLLAEIYDVEVPAGVVVGPAADLATIAAHLSGDAAGRPTFASVHGADATEVHARDLRLAHFVDTDTLAAAPHLPGPEPTPRTVLLTGANGYLGRFLALEWLERLAERGGRLVCLVRGRDGDDARRRLDTAFDSGDAELRDRFATLAAAHLEVLAGDVGAPDLGLDAATWRRLAEEVDLVVHPAAMVNHVLPYRQLFEPNVVGTAEVARLALTTRIKPVTYLSTVAVVAGTDIAEDADIREAAPTRSLDERYAGGYAVSKWAGEVLLAEAHERCGLPVSVFRSDMILAHRRWAGQLNVTDMFTRLLYSVAVTGLAPWSFHAASSAVGERPRAHYDGLPVDFTAAAVTALGERTKDEHASFNVLNPHTDGISLDVVVDRLVETGQPITRIDSYDEWLERFTTALRGLPEDRRRASVLPLLDAFARPEEPVDGTTLPTAHFRAGVRDAGVEGGTIPHLDHDLIAKYVHDLRGLGLLAS